MTNASPTVRTAAKDILARLLASEDLTVQHSAAAPTACFDTVNRVLTLPIWEDMDSEMYDMLVGHEVSHALFTPADGWQEFVGDDQDTPLRHMCLNVCEDVRIERKIKDKFPGLRRDFSKAYKSFHDRDIFELKGKSVKDLPLIDRINLYYKGEIYGQMTVPFSQEERQWITRLDAAETFESIMEIAEDLLEVTKEEQEDVNPIQSEGELNAGTGEGAGEFDSMRVEGEDTGGSMEDDTDDGASADSEDGDVETDGVLTDDLSYESYKNESATPGQTQHNYEQAREEMRNTESLDYDYRTLPTTDLNRIVISHDRIARHWEQFWVNSISLEKQDSRSRANLALHEFQTRSKPIISHMVQQFQRKQAADASKRTSIAKTGILDTTTMINYRWSEDIFLKNEVHPDGKNHGLVIFLDWSGSMSRILKDTVEQLLVLVEFCRQAGIPYDVHAFTSVIFDEDMSLDDGWHRSPGEEAYAEAAKQFTETRESDIKPHSFQLLNFLSSKQNNKKHTEAVKNLYYTAIGEYRSGPRAFGLGSTPLNEAILTALDLVPEFQSANNVQICNTIFLTDGDGHTMVWGKNRCKTIVHDQKTRRDYEIDQYNNCETSSMLQLLKDRTGCNTIGIRLHDSNSIKGLHYRFWKGLGWEEQNKVFAEAVVAYRKDHHFTVEGQGYDLFLLIKGNLKVETDALEELNEDASYTKIKNAFIKGGNRKKSSRVIANRVVDLIAM
jgi:hypothetical protein